MINSSTNRLFAILVLMVNSTLVGCSSTVPASDAEQASDLLKRSLDAWQSGRNFGEQKQRNPPVYVVEDFWQSGHELLDYSILTSEVQGTNLTFDVDLQLRNDRGRKLRSRVRYIVTTNPALTIVRVDE